MSREGILACGYYGFGNLGDEAVLAGLVRGLRQAGYAGTLTVLSADAGYTERAHGVQAIPRTDLRAVWKAMRQSRVFVLGGGSLIQDVTSARSVVYYLGMHALARRTGCRVAWVGQGIGPLRRGWVRRWTAAAARQADVVIARDPTSAELLRSMGVSHVQSGADLSFLLPDADTERGWELLQRFGVRRGRALMAIAPRPYAGAQARLVQWFCSLARYAGRACGAQVLLLPMHASRDRELVEEIARGVTNSIALVEPLSVMAVKEVLACCQVVVGMRLHALMLAAASAVPTIALSYDPKVRAFGEQSEPQYVVELTDANEQVLQQRLCDLWEGRALARERLQPFARQQRELAQHNIDAVLGLVS